MNYTCHYDKLISRARTRNLTGYVEVHHIIPTCMLGSNSPENLVKLTPEEHYFAHLLLVKMYPSHPQLICALGKMTANSPYHHRSGRKLYGWLKRRHSVFMKEAQSGNKNSQYGSSWYNNGSTTIKVASGDLPPEGFLRGKIKKIHPINRCIDCGNVVGNRKKFRCKSCALRVSQKAQEHRIRMAILAQSSTACEKRAITRDQIDFNRGSKNPNHRSKRNSRE